MISPELLRRYPFFNFMNDTELKAVAMIAEEVVIEKGAIIFNAKETAQMLYFLEDGSATNFFIVENGGSKHKELYIGEINPGEIFGISALIEPYVYTATMRADKKCRVIRIEASALRALCEVDTRLAYTFMQATAKAVLQRLESTRVQLATAQAH
jgi:CRP-like cAMP-binding protein